MASNPETTDRAALLEALARAICCPEGCEVIGCRGRIYEREAAAALAAIETAARVVPIGVTDRMFDAGHAEHAHGTGIIATYLRMVAASPYAQETPDAR